MKEYEAVLFDLDGTLMDTSPGVIECMRKTLNELSLPDADDSEILKFIGPPAGEFFRVAYGFSQEDAHNASNLFRVFFEKGAYLNAVPYPNIDKLLYALHNRGYKLGVATNKHLNQTVSMFDYFGFARYFDSVCGADDSFSLTKADIINKAISELGVEREKTVIIGDSKFDAIGAAQAKIDFIAVTYGLGFKNSDEVSPFMHEACCASVDEIAALFDVEF